MWRNGRCGKDNGVCEDSICKAKFYGAQCNNTCPIGCGGDGSCDLNGYCDQGCEAGWQGDKCSHGMWLYHIEPL